MENNYLIEVVEDDIPVSNLITVTLQANGYRTIRAENGELAVTLAASHSPDIILLDLGLPGLDGIEVIKRIRSWADSIPIIVVSARNEEEDKIDALDAGADDYLTKPFSVGELMARIRVAVRRLSSAQNALEESKYRNGDLTIDYAAGYAAINGTELKLTGIEYKLLSLLARNQGKVLTHRYIMRSVWGQDDESILSSLRVYMAMLRKKLDADDTGKYIQTHIGIGYRMIKTE